MNSQDKNKQCCEKCADWSNEGGRQCIYHDEEMGCPCHENKCEHGEAKLGCYSSCPRPNSQEKGLCHCYCKAQYLKEEECGQELEVGGGVYTYCRLQKEHDGLCNPHYTIMKDGLNQENRPPFQWDDELMTLAKKVGKSITKNEQEELRKSAIEAGKVIREAEKRAFMSKIANLASKFDNEDEILQEASDKFDEEHGKHN